MTSGATTFKMTLDIAISLGRLEDVESLINAGANVNKKFRNRKSLLQRAAQNGRSDIVKALISAGADVHAKDKSGSTPLHYFRNDDEEVIRAFISAGADVNAKSSCGELTPLHYSAEMGYAKNVKALIAAGADVNAKYYSKNTPLHYAARGGYLDIVKALVSAGADIHAIGEYGETPLNCVFRNNEEIVKVLISAGSDVNADVSFRGILHTSAQEGYMNIVKILIAAGADVNVKDSGGETPLHCSAFRGHSKIVKVLIAAGADVNMKDEYGKTPLLFLAYKDPLWYNSFKSNEQDFKDILKALIAAGADINAKDLYNKAALDIVVEKEEFFRCMIKYTLLYTDISKRRPLPPRRKHSITFTRKLWDTYKQQIEELKKTFLRDSSVSLFEFLTGSDENKTALYSSEERFGMKTDIDNISFFEKFLLFTEDIKHKFFVGIKRADLLVKTQTLLKQHSICKILPIEILREITEYLEMEDLENVLVPLHYNLEECRVD